MLLLVFARLVCCLLASLLPGFRQKIQNWLMSLRQAVKEWMCSYKCPVDMISKSPSSSISETLRCSWRAKRWSFHRGCKWQAIGHHTVVLVWILAIWTCYHGVHLWFKWFPDLSVCDVHLLPVLPQWRLSPLLYREWFGGHLYIFSKFLLSERVQGSWFDYSIAYLKYYIY